MKRSFNDTRNMDQEKTKRNHLEEQKRKISKDQMAQFKKNKLLNLSPFGKKVLLACVLFIICIIGLFYYINLSTRISLYITGEIDIVHEPYQKVIQTERNGTIPVRLQTTIDPAGQCVAQCRFFAQVSATNVYEKQVNISQKHTVIHDLQIPLPAHGQGITSLSFFSSCVNQESVFCPSTQNEFLESSLILINYTLTKAEQTIIQNQETYQELMLQYFLLAKLSEDLERTLQVLPFDVNDSSSQFTFHQPSMDVFYLQNKNISELVKLWNNEDYTSFTNAYEKTQLINNQPLTFTQAINLTRNEKLATYQHVLSTIATYDYWLTNAQNISFLLSSAMFLQNNSDATQPSLQHLSKLLDHTQEYENEIVQKHVQIIKTDFEKIRSFDLQYMINVSSETKKEPLPFVQSFEQLLNLANEFVVNNEEKREILNNFLQKWYSVFNETSETDNQHILFNNSDRLIPANSTQMSQKMCNATHTILNQISTQYQQYNETYTAKIDVPLSDFSEQHPNSTPATIQSWLIGLNLSAQQYMQVMNYSDSSCNNLNKSSINQQVQNDSLILDYATEFGIRSPLNTTAHSLFFEMLQKRVTYQQLKAEQTAHRQRNSLSIAEPVSVFELFSAQNLTLSKPANTCCYGTKCEECLDVATPILFIHGHAFSEQNTPFQAMQSFKFIQQKLSDEGYIDAGVINSQQLAMLEPASLHVANHPLTFRASYYYISHFSIGNMTFSLQQSERIENYALRLHELIESIKRVSGSPKVIIVAHSMGGLVARQYTTFFGYDSIERIITINTPHQGIDERIYRACKVFGSDKECEDMKQNSVFLQRLAPVNESKYVIISSAGCLMEGLNGDGIVLAKNSKLENVHSYELYGSCDDTLGVDLHTKILNINTYPKTFSLLLTLLNESVKSGPPTFS